MPVDTITPEVEPLVEERSVRVDEQKPIDWKQRVRDLLIAIFEGHEEFLGWTPD
jgi:hypothetical protein